MEEKTQQIREAMSRIQEKIDLAAKKSGRNPAGIHLVVVTKAQPVAVVKAAIEAGATILGENYPEETVEKMPEIRSYTQVAWHMIGHLQSRKARLVYENFDMLQSLDSLHLAQKIERGLAEMGKKLPVLLEFNVGGEESKSGWQAGNEKDWPALLPEVEGVLAMPTLQVKGLMTMPPLFEDPEATRPHFQKLRRLRDFLAARYPQASWDELSMGTSVDYEVAVEEGATYVRIGTAIVGARPPR